MEKHLPNLYCYMVFFSTIFVLFGFSLIIGGYLSGFQLETELGTQGFMWTKAISFLRWIPKVGVRLLDHTWL